MAAVGKPPGDCRTFYVAPEPDRAPDDVQVDAMMVALAQHLPTINGYSGLRPPSWHLEPDASDYDRQAEAWAAKRGIAKGLCRVEIQNGSWTLLSKMRLESQRK
jgi:hypothetical protein